MSRKQAHLLYFVLVLSASVNVVKADITSDLISHWKLDDGSGIIAKDSAGSNDGTLKSNARWSQGWMGGAIELDGDDDYVDCGQGTVFNSVCRDVITLAAWVKADTTLGPNWGGIIVRGYGYMYGTVSPYDTFAMYFHKTSESLGFKTTGTANESSVESPTHSAAVLSDGGWHHVAMVYDGTEKVIYLDSEIISKWAETGQITSGEGTGRVILGGGRDIEPMVIEFGGRIDDARIYNRAMTKEEIVAVMENIENLPSAMSPDPPDGTLLMDTWVNLSWHPGDFAVSHDIYLGDDFDAVSNDDVTGQTFRANQTGTFYVAGFPGHAYPEGLVPGTTYYWRIDEVNEAESGSPWKGPIWSFSIAPPTAYNPNPPDGAEFIGPNYVTLSWTAGFGSILHKVYFGDDYDTVANATVGIPAGKTAYSPGPLEAEKVYYWRVDEFDGTATHKGGVWTFTTPGAVGNPQPANGATDVAMTTILSWTSADNAASHQVYVGLDKDTVRSADTSSPEYVGPKALGAESHDPGSLELNTTYYWRVDEVYNRNTVKGPIWSFTIGNYLLVEDFESYTDDDPNNEAIWQTWVDGFGVADNGAQVGNLIPPYCEQTIVHGGAQSMPLFYANESGVTNSEAVLPLATLRDWTVGGVANLSLWFRGDSDNAAEPLYVAISNSAGAPGVVANDDPDAAAKTSWKQWRISLQAFADQGINLTNVNKIAIGLGSKSGVASSGGSGTMYIDDIRLYQP